MSGPPDLFVVCKSCGSEVSPYITECPYCGKRLQKRAPKIERDAAGESQPQLKRRPKPPPLPRVREIRGLGGGDEERRPYVTAVLVLLAAFGFVVLVFASQASLGLFGPLESEYWRLVITPFLDPSASGQFPSLVALALFGTLLERRHGPVLVLLLWLLAATGGAAVVAALQDDPFSYGANGGALAFVLAWLVPVGLGRRARAAGDDDDADVLGALVIGAVVLVLPLAGGYSWTVALWGALTGALVGLALARVKPR